MGKVDLVLEVEERLGLRSFNLVFAEGLGKVR